jgi:anaerobic selenocysteine-containing dehydrogenase
MVFAVKTRRRFVMPDEKSNNEEASGISRRNFLKSAGVVVTGSALGTGLTLATGATAAQQVAPDAPQKKVATWHPANAVTVKLKVNGKENQV